MPTSVTRNLLHAGEVVVCVGGPLLSEDLDDPAARLLALGLAAPVALADSDSSVCSHSSSSFGVMFTASSNSSITCRLSSPLAIACPLLLLGLAEGVGLVGGLLAALLALDEVARVVL